jgi:hypothetical protein
MASLTMDLVARMLLATPERWPSPARREPKQFNLEGRRESAVAGQVHGPARPPGLKDRYKP